MKRSSVIIVSLLMIFILHLYAGDKGKVYLVLGSDTSIWEGLSTSAYGDRYFKSALYTNPNRHAYAVMDSSFRNQYKDSNGTPFKMTWWMMAGNVFDMSKNCNIPVRTNISLHLMKKYHAKAIETWDDQLSLHYHTYRWSDPQGDGTYMWEKAEKFILNKEDYERTLCTFLVEDDVFPVSFRSGWMYMDEDWQNYQERFIPFDMSDCWSTLSDGSAPFHPSAENYRKEGDMKQWRVRSVYYTMNAPLKQGLESVFNQASQGKDQMLCLWSHLPENEFLNYIDTLNRISHKLSEDKHVEFQYCNDVEAMRLWIAPNDTIAPKISASKIIGSDGLRIRISTDGPVFQEAEPFVAAKDIYETYRRINCTLTGINTWETTQPLDPEKTAKLAIAVCDSAGNQATYHMDFIPDDIYIDDQSSNYQEISGNWTDYTSNCELWNLQSRMLRGAGKLILSPNIKESRNYALFMHAPGANTDSLRLIVNNSALADTFFVNKVMEGRDHWQFFGFYDLELGNNNTISIENLDTNLTLGFDAMRITPLIADKYLLCDKDVITFGEVSIEDTAEQTIKLSNIGNEELVINDFYIYGSKLNYDINLPLTLAPMQSKEVKFIYSSEKFCEYSDILTIKTDDPQHPVVYIPIIATSNTYYQVVDNEDTNNYQEFGSWSTSSSKAWGEASRYSAISSHHNYANYSVELKYSGAYNIQFIIPASTNAHDHANYILIVDGTIIDTMIVNQNNSKTFWRSIGEFDLPKNTPIVLRVQDNGGSTESESLVLRTDAVKFELVEEKFISSINHAGIPNDFKLYSNYPNPFNPSTNIYFALSEPGKVKIEFFNIQGKKVDVTFEQNMEAGYHRVQWTPKNLASGTYIYKLSTLSNVAVNKCTLIK